MYRYINAPPIHPHIHIHPHPHQNKASPDAHADYNALMNCIFSAHRSAVPVDACVLSFEHGAANGPGPRDSSFLQQATYITGEKRRRKGRDAARSIDFQALAPPTPPTYVPGGVYVRPERQDALLQYFLSLFLPGHRLRQVCVRVLRTYTYMDAYIHALLAAMCTQGRGRRSGWSNDRWSAPRPPTQSHWSPQINPIYPRSCACPSRSRWTSAPPASATAGPSSR